MDKKIIFEIPVYAMGKGKFEDKWVQKEKKLFENSPFETLEEYKKNLDGFFSAYRVWKYNQIIGYIVISISKNDVWFDRYLADIRGVPFDSKQKHFIRNMHMNGMHFYTANMDNEQIITSTKDMLEGIIKNFIDKRCYVDKDVFNNLIDNIDIKALMKNFKELSK